MIPAFYDVPGDAKFTSTVTLLHHPSMAVTGPELNSICNPQPSGPYASNALLELATLQYVLWLDTVAIETTA
jgi:hypothetical protein